MSPLLPLESFVKALRHNKCMSRSIRRIASDDVIEPSTCFELPAKSPFEVLSIGDAADTCSDCIQSQRVMNRLQSGPMSTVRKLFEANKYVEDSLFVPNQ